MIVGGWGGVPPGIPRRLLLDSDGAPFLPADTYRVGLVGVTEGQPSPRTCGV